MNFFIESFGIGENTVINCFKISFRIEHTCTAKTTKVGKFIKIIEHNLERLETTPRQTSHSTVFSVGKNPESFFIVRNNFVEQQRCKIGTEACPDFTYIFTRFRSEHCRNTTITYYNYHGLSFAVSNQ